MAKNILRMSIITKSAFYPISSLCRNDAMLAEASLKFSAIAGLLVSLAYLRDVAVGWRQLLQRRRQSNSNQRLWIRLHSSTHNIINSIQHTVTLPVNSSLCIGLAKDDVTYHQHYSCPHLYCHLSSIRIIVTC